MVGENESIAATLGQGEALARSSQPVNYAPGIFLKYLNFFGDRKLIIYNLLGGHNEEDSKQAAEAMVQLSGVGFYNQQGKLILIKIDLKKHMLTSS